MQHLEEIATKHQGKIPLHGRLFSQWMHHAYPRECPYPHQSSTSKPMTADEWLQEAGNRRVIPRAQLPQFIKEQKEWEAQAKVKDLVDGDFDDTMPWIAEEELVAHHSPPTLKHELCVLFRALVFIVTVFSVTTSLATLVSSATSSTKEKAMKGKLS